MILRGDSTLRGHVYEEYLGLRDAGHGGPALLLVPALPHAGRRTVDGVHLLGDVPLHATEYATDGGFAYRDARLLRWAEERSGGALPAAAGREVAPDGVAGALRELAAAGVPAACVPDVWTTGDLATVRAGLVDALRDGAGVVVRAGPAFAAELGGTTATGPAPVPSAPGGVLLVCGSHVPTSTRQLAALDAAYPASVVEAEIDALLDGRVDAIADAARSALTRTRLAAVRTPRARAPLSVEEGARLADRLAQVAAALEPFPSVLIAKGGITSHVTLTTGVGADTAEVVGPLADGVALWRTTRPYGAAVAYVVVPGNVGDDDLLVHLTAAILEAPC